MRRIVLAVITTVVMLGIAIYYLMFPDYLGALAFFISASGMSLNLWVVIANGGRMPVVTKDQDEAKRYEGGKSHFIADKNIRLGWLADKYDIWIGKASLGDLVLAISWMLLLVWVMSKILFK